MSGLGSWGIRCLGDGDRRKILAPAAQTTVGDFGECSLAGGFTPRPGLVAYRRRARSKPSSSRQRPFAANLLTDLAAKQETLQKYEDEQSIIR